MSILGRSFVEQRLFRLALGIMAIVLPIAFVLGVVIGYVTR